MIRFREAQRGEVAEIVALFADDILGRGREGGEIAPYETPRNMRALWGGRENP